MASSEANESPRIEIEIATVLLGFLFVMDSLILTMPSDVLSIVENVQVTGYLGVPILSFGDLFSLASFYCSLLLLVAIPLYLFYLRMRTRVILVTARCFLAVSMYLIVILVVLLNGAFMARLVGTKATTYMNPITGQVLSFSIFIMIAYILASWIWYIFSRFSHRQSLQKGKQGNADRQSMKNKNKSTAKPQKQKVFR